ncbi:MAG: hypothetical protein ACK42Z_05690 [Candidatus Kapaibacteriota bacterium]
MKKLLATMIFSLALSMLNVEGKRILKPLTPIILRTEAPQKNSLLIDFIKPIKNYLRRLYLN